MIEGLKEEEKIVMSCQMSEKQTAGLSFPELQDSATICASLAL